MDRTEFDLNNTLLSSTSKSISISSDYEKAAEFGRCLLEQNQELQSYIGVLQQQIDDKQSDMKVLEARFLSTREQLDEKCKQTDVLDAANYDLEQELAAQRRDNDKNRQHIRELFGLCEKTRKQCHDIEQEYETFRSKELSSYFPSTKPSSLSSRRQRAHSFNLKPIPPPSPSVPLEPSTFFDPSSATIYKSHLRELKARIHSLTSECTLITDQLHRSEQEKHELIERITQLERQRRDDNDTLQNEVNHYRKLVEKSTHEAHRSMATNLFSLPEHDLSLYEEVRLELPLYQPTNYQALFAPLYEKLKSNLTD